MTIHNRVYEVNPAVVRLQILVEDYPDGRQTIALRFATETAWGVRHSPVIDDDGDRIVSDPEFADYLASLPSPKEGK